MLGWWTYLVLSFQKHFIVITIIVRHIIANSPIVLIPSNFREEDNWLNEHNMYPRLYYCMLNQLNYVYVIKLEFKER